MNQRTCEKCGAELSRAVGVCSQCGWENDFKHYVDISEKPSPTQNELAEERERELWGRQLIPLCIGCAIALTLVELALTFFWNPNWWIVAAATPVFVVIQSLLLGFYVWLGADQGNAVTREGGGAIFSGKCIAAALIAHLVYGLLVIPFVWLSGLFIGGLLFWPIYALWLFIAVVVNAAGWLLGIMYLFRFPFQRSAFLTLLIWATQLGVGGFFLWLLS